MAGSIEHLLTGAAGTIARDAFTYLYNLINGYSNTTVIASYYGFGGSGFGLSGAPDQSGENAWFAWEWSASGTSHGKPVFGLAQWCYAEAIGAHGAPAAGYGTYGLFASFACCDGGGFAWNGTTNNNGADTKGTPVWYNATQNVIPFPRCNSLGGAYATNREGMTHLCAYASPSRVQLYATPNGLYTFVDEANDGSYKVMVFESLRSRVSHVVPLFQIADSLSSAGLNASADYGGLTQTNFRDGGLAHPDPTMGTRSFRIDRWNYQELSIMNPSVNGIYLAPRSGLNLYDSQGVGSYGPVGVAYDLREIGNVPVHSSFNGLSSVVYGPNATTAPKLWVGYHDGVTVPGTGVTASGVQFGF